MNGIARRFQNVRGTRQGSAGPPRRSIRCGRSTTCCGATCRTSSTASSVVRRNYEYDHHYGLRLDGQGAASEAGRQALEIPRGVPQPAAPVHEVLQAGRRHDGQGRRLPGAERAEGSAPDPLAGPAQPVRRPAVDRPRRDADAAMAAGAAGVPRVPADAHQGRPTPSRGWIASMR